MTNLIYTVGTEGLAPADLARWATATGEPAMLDIRWSPWSRRPEWNMPALLATMPQYLWLGRVLGNREYKENRIELADPERGVRIASRVLQRRSIVLLCHCASHWSCHRAEAAELIATETGATIQPVTADEVRGVHQFDLLAPFTHNHRVTG